jgi:hypothetical protein
MQGADTVRRFLGLLFQDGDVFEVRAPDCRERRDSRYTFTCSGYFTTETLDAAVAGIAELDRAAIAPGIYVTINPVAPALLARAANRIKMRARETTADKDIVRRRWLLIDVDPVRPAGISATDAELAQSRQRARAIAEHHASLGWPRPIQAMSGNGHHLLYRIDLPTDDGGLVKSVLAALADRFSDNVVTIDRSVHNPARIIKVAGTVSRKGDDLRGAEGLEDRPHRRSEFIEVPEQIVTLSEELLRAVAGPQVCPEDATWTKVDGENGAFDCTSAGVRAWLENHGARVKGERRNGTKTMLLLERCPINPDIISTGASDIAVLVGDDGRLAYCNKHNRGQDYTWHDLRRALNPGGTPSLGEAGVDLSNFSFAPLPKGNLIVPPPPRIQLIRADQIEVRSPHWLLRGMVERDTFALIFGDPGCGKSFLAIDWACRVATASPWRGHAVRGGPVVFVAGEGQQGFGRRIRAWSEHHGVSLTDMPLYLAPAVAIPQPTDLVALITAIDTGVATVGQPALIVLDTLARCFGGGDENSTQDMSRFVAACDAIRQRYGCTILVVHHAGHGDKSRARGAIALKAALDAEYRLANDTGLLLTATKMKDAEMPAPLGLELVTVDLPGLLDDDGIPVTSAAIEVLDAETSAIIAQVTVGRGRGKWQEVGLAVARKLIASNNDGLSPLDAWREACAKAGMVRQNQHRVLDALVKRGEIIVTGDFLSLQDP